MCTCLHVYVTETDWRIGLKRNLKDRKCHWRDCRKLRSLSQMIYLTILHIRWPVQKQPLAEVASQNVIKRRLMAWWCQQTSEWKSRSDSADWTTSRPSPLFPQSCSILSKWVVEQYYVGSRQIVVGHQRYTSKIYYRIKLTMKLSVANSSTLWIPNEKESRRQEWRNFIAVSLFPMKFFHFLISSDLWVKECKSISSC